MKVLPIMNTNQYGGYSFDDLVHGLDGIGISTEVKYIIFDVLAAILHLCNIEFIDDSFQKAEISNNLSSHESLNFAANLLKIDPDELKHALITKTIKTNTDTSCISYVYCII